MEKRNKIVVLLCIIINAVVTFLIARGRWVNRMPSPGLRYSFMDNIYDLYIGRGFLTIITSLLTVIGIFIINKLILKQDNKIKIYIILFGIIFILDVIIYRLGIRIAV